MEDIGIATFRSYFEKLSADIQNFWIDSYCIGISLSDIEDLIRNLDNVIKTSIQSKFPNIGYISQSTKDLSSSGNNWYINLMDNPIGYSRGGKNYGCGLTLVIGNQIYLGAIHSPSIPGKLACN